MSESCGTVCCADCRFWDAIDEEALDGFCRIARPAMQGTIAPHGSMAFQLPQHGIWPITHPDDWCGEHIPATDGRVG